MDSRTTDRWPNAAALAVVFMVTVLLSTANVLSQSSRPGGLDLETAVKMAFENDPRSRKADVGIRIADSRISEARSARKPVVRFGQSFTASNNPVFVFGSLLEQGRFTTENFALNSLNDPSTLANFRTAVDVRFPLLDQGKAKTDVTRAEIARKQADLAAEVVRQRLRFDVIRSFYGSVLALELIGVSDEAVRSATENRRKTRDMVDVGMVMESDSLAAEVELANTEQQRLEADANLVNTLSALNILIGNKPDLQSAISASLQERYFPVSEQDQLIAMALRERPDLLQAQLEIDSGREQARGVKNERKPRVDAVGNFGYSSPYLVNGSSDYAVGVSLTYTLFDAGRKHREDQATESVTLAELDKENLENQIRLEVIRSLQNHKTAGSKIKVSIKSIAQAEEALRIIQDRYKFGLTTFNEVLRGETALVRAKHNLLAARYDYIVSYASLLLATGRLTDVSAFD